MIRADWTPLWAADWSNCKALGRKQVECLELLRDRGPMTASELRQAGTGLSTCDKLSLSRPMYPRLVAFRDDADAQRYFLAAPGQQAELDAVLEVVAAHPDGINPELLARDSEPARLWRSVVIDHIINAGLARTNHNWVLYPVTPWDRPAASAWWAERVARRGLPPWQKVVAPA
jgi:hypothetical protein